LGGLYFLCSIGEILLAYFFARHLWGENAGLWSAGIAALLPLNVTLAGSLNPDAYLALTIETSFVTFYFAQRSGSGWLYFLAGLLAGWVFWIKEVVFIYGFVFLLLAAAEKRWDKGWLWFIAGGTLCVLADLAFFLSVYGDPLYQFRIVQSAVSEYVGQEIADTSLGLYFTYLFAKIYHTGLLGWLALAGVIAALRRPHDRDLRFVLIWGLGLLLVFSALPISFSPLKFIGKQSNYMEIFLMPLTLLAGWFMSRQREGVKIAVGAALIGSGILLSAMEQQTIRVVAANGKVAMDFTKAHPGVPVFGSETVARHSVLARILNGSLDHSKDIRELGDLKDFAAGDGAPADVVAYAIDDPQLIYWSRGRKDAALTEKIRACRTTIERLPLPEDLGWGRPIVGALYDMAALLPPSLARPVRGQFEPIYRVAPATAYAITRDCVRNGLS
jgi:hypothetical protein